MVKNLGLFGSNTIAFPKYSNQSANTFEWPQPPKPVTGGVGTHTSYETDPSGNRMEVTYDATGKIVGSRKVGRGEGSEYAAGSSGGVPMNASNWQKLIALLQSKFGISL